MTRIRHQINFVSHRTHAPRIMQWSVGALIIVSLLLGTTLLDTNPSQKRAAIVALTTSTPQTLTAESTTSRAPVPVSMGAGLSLTRGVGADTIRFYEPTGRAFEAELRGSVLRTIADRKLSGFVRTWWSSNGSSVLSQFQETGRTSFRFFDYQTGNSSTLPNNIQSIAISPDGRRVAYVAPSSDALAVFVATLDGSDPRKIIGTRAEAIELSWPQADRIIMVSKQANRPGRDMRAIMLDGTTEILLTNRQNLEYAWSRHGTTLLFSYFRGGTTLVLGTYDMTSGTESPLGIETSARKCAWHDDDRTITCGVPTTDSLSSAADASKTASVDEVISLDTLTRAQILHWRTRVDMPIGIIDPLISSSGAYFVFVNIFNQRIYAMRL